jgi:flagellar protein FliS
MEAGKHAIVNKNLEKQNYYIQKAQRIVTELMATLDMQQGGEVAKNLFALYGYVLNELVTANIEDQTEPIERAIRVFSELRESWAQIAEASVPRDQPMAA